MKLFNLFKKKSPKITSRYAMRFDNIKTVEDVIKILKAYDMVITTHEYEVKRRLDPLVGEGLLSIKEYIQ